MFTADWSGNLGPCRLVRHTGETWSYENLDALVRDNHNILIKNLLSDRPPLLSGVRPKNEYVRIDDHHEYRRRMMKDYGYDPFAPWDRPWYVVLDELDLIVPPWKVLERAYALRLFDRWYWPWYTPGVDRKTRKRTYMFRQGVVPGTGHSRGRHRCYMRRPHTTAERRQYERDLVDEDLEDFPQLRVRNRHLRHSYDDIPRNKPRKSWKSQRKTQYRPT